MRMPGSQGRRRARASAVNIAGAAIAGVDLVATTTNSVATARSA